MPKVCVVVTARPSYSRIKTALAALRARPDVELQVIAAASAIVTRYGRVVDQIRADGFPVVAELPSVVDGDSGRESAISTGLLTSQLASLFGVLNPDWVVTIADRHETLATAIAASYAHIPLCHIQGGEVSGSIDDKVRNAVTQLADLHLVATAKARDRVLALRPGATVHVTGCPSIDIAADALRQGPLPGHDVVVLQHSVTGEAGEAGAQIKETIKALEGMDVLWFWPGEDAGNQAIAKEMRLAGLKPVRNMEPVTFLRTLLGSGVLVGNSSVGIRECSFLGVPAVMIGTRQWNRENAGNIVTLIKPQADAEHIRHWVRIMSAVMGPASIRKCSALYGDGHAGERIAAILNGERVKELAA